MMATSFTRLFKQMRCLSHRYISTASKSGGTFSTDLSAYSSVTHGITPLNSCGIIKVTGKDAPTFLQGLVSNDVVKNTSSYNAILAPNGRYLYDCFISQFDGDHFIETHS